MLASAIGSPVSWFRMLMENTFSGSVLQTVVVVVVDVVVVVVTVVVGDGVVHVSSFSSHSI